MIELQNATKRFGAKTLFENLTLRITHGEKVTLIAPSGSGKSTLLRIIVGLESLDEGELFIDGQLATKDKSIIIPPHKRSITMVFQEPTLWPHMSVEENVAFGLKMQKVPKKEQKERVEAMLKRVGLAGFGKKEVTTLSGGEKQRVSLARALAVHPKRVLMDEPLSSLDATSKRELLEMIVELQKEFGCTLLYVTHNFEEAKFIGGKRLTL